MHKREPNVTHRFVPGIIFVLVKYDSVIRECDECSGIVTAHKWRNSFEPIAIFDVFATDLMETQFQLTFIGLRIRIFI